MASRVDLLEIVALFDHDLFNFRDFLEISKGRFSKEYKLNKNLFADRLANRHTPSIPMIEKCYRAMGDAGFISERRKQQYLLKAAYEGDLTEVLEIAKELAGENAGEA